MDEVIWGSADGLLKAIDNQFCKKGDGTYDYNKRNLTTSHVHAMLTTAILNSIDKSETVIFMNTDNPVPKLRVSFKKMDSIRYLHGFTKSL